MVNLIENPRKENKSFENTLLNAGLWIQEGKNLKSGLRCRNVATMLKRITHLKLSTQQPLILAFSYIIFCFFSIVRVIQAFEIRLILYLIAKGPSILNISSVSSIMW